MALFQHCSSCNRKIKAKKLDIFAEANGYLLLSVCLVYNKYDLWAVQPMSDAGIRGRVVAAYKNALSEQLPSERSYLFLKTKFRFHRKRARQAEGM